MTSVIPSISSVHIEARIHEPALAAAQTAATPAEKAAAIFAAHAEALQHDAQVADPLYQGHFARSQQEIMAAARGLTGTALVVGINAVRDIPLIALAEQFDRIDLVYMDLTIVQAALLEVPELLRGKFHLQQADLAGIWAELIEKTELLNSSATQEEFVTEILPILLNLARHKFAYPERTASFVVSSLVSSQLPQRLFEYLEERSMALQGKSLVELLGDRMWDLSAVFASIEHAHMRDLHSWVIPEGNIYFADDFSIQEITRFQLPTGQTIEDRSQPIRTLMAAAKVQALADELFAKLTEVKWPWSLPQSRKQVTILLRNPLQQDGLLMSVWQTVHEEHAITSWALRPKSP